MVDNFKSKYLSLISNLLSEHFSLSSDLIEKVESLSEVPKDFKNGNLAIPCFLLSKELKKSPQDVAIELCELINSKNSLEFLDKVVAVGPYVNAFWNQNIFFKKIIESMEQNNYISSTENKTIVIESPSPNTNKPLHLGHVRNMLLGLSITNILKKVGNNVNLVNLNNDRGLHICKSMIAYKLWGDNKTPESENIKSDLFVGQFYVEFAKKVKDDPSLEESAKKMLIDWENGDKEVVELWNKMRTWALNGFYETYNSYGIKHDKEYFESEIYKDGREIIERGLSNGLFQKEDDGAVFVDLEDKKLGKKYLLREDGTSIYIVQDIFLATLKEKDFSPDKSVFIVGNEQEYHFKVLFEILGMLGICNVESNYHFSYGMINLPEGKMKSREGNVVDADGLLIEVKENAKEELLKREPEMPLTEVDMRSTIISKAAINYFILKYDPLKDFIFNPKESLSFEGETGPYLLYTYARIKSIFRKVDIGENEISNLNCSYDSLSEYEIKLLNILETFENCVYESAKNFKPSILSRFLMDTAQSFNEFYQHCNIMKEEVENLKNARLKICNSTAIILKDGLSLLGIDVLEQM